MNTLFTKSFLAVAAIAGFRIVAFGTGGIETANAATDAILGVSDKMGAGAGEMCDVHLAGILPVAAGGNIARGDPLTSDDEGRAIKAVPTAGSVVRIIGFAVEDAVENDVFHFHSAPSVLATPAA